MSFKESESESTLSEIEIPIPTGTLTIKQELNPLELSLFGFVDIQGGEKLAEEIRYKLESCKLSKEYIVLLNGQEFIVYYSPENILTKGFNEKYINISLYETLLQYTKYPIKGKGSSLYNVYSFDNYHVIIINPNFDLDSFIENCVVVDCDIGSTLIEAEIKQVNKKRWWVF